MKSAKQVPVPTTLAEARDALVRTRPRHNAPASAWRDYHLTASRFYAEVAKSDEAHRYEAQACAALERAKAAKLSSGSNLDSTES